MIGFVPLASPIHVRVLHACDAVGDGNIPVKLAAGQKLVWTLTRYDGCIVAYDPADRYHPENEVERLITIDRRQVVESKTFNLEPRSLIREVNAPVDGDADRRVLLQVHEEALLVEQFGDHAVVLHRGIRLVVRTEDLEEVQVSAAAIGLAV